MRLRFAVFAAVLGVTVALFTSGGRAADQTLVAAGSSWRYNDTGTLTGTSWRLASYVDSGWPIGGAQLGYGDGDEATVLSYGPDPNNRHVTYYFRHTFSVPDPTTIQALTLRLMRDDGAVVYLNGSEVMRSNLPTGPISSSTLATVAIAGTDESAWLEAPVDPARLVPGTNLIAVEVHQQALNSSDVTFDLELRTTNAGPSASVSLAGPIDHGVVNNAAVTFTANVWAAAGLSSATLQIGGPPQTVTFSGAAAIQDTQITADTPAATAGDALSVNVDGASPHAHGLLKIPSLIGSGGGQVPGGSIIVSATLTLNCTNLGQTMSAYRLTENWVENQATWAQKATGVPWGAPGADGPASNAGMSLPADCTATGLRQTDLTTFVQEWSNGSSNFGILIADSGSDGVDFSSSESASSPVLTVVYRQPLIPFLTVPVSGTSATVNIPAVLPSPSTFTWNIEVTDTTLLKKRAPADFELTVNTAAPHAPAAVSPINGASGVNPTAPLVAMVSTPGGGAMSATAQIRKASGDEFTIIVLPDTQHYSEAFPQIFNVQTQWIVANKAARNIVFVTHEGDIVEHYNLPLEWERANASMTVLDGVVPYGLAPGNHDIPSMLYNQYFPFTRYAGLPWYGDHYQNNNDNNFQLFSGGGIDFVAVHLEFCPSPEVLAWAKSVFDDHPNEIGMMTTHGYLNESAQRTVHGCTNTQPLWDNLGAITPNLHFMLSGHVHDESRRVDVANGHPVFQMLADYQARASGGEGWLRILRFVPSENKVYVQTYSPWLDRFETDANSQFTLDFQMSEPFVTSAPFVGASGGNATFNVSGLQPLTEYEWRVTATNAASHSRTGPLWKFTTGTGAVNQPPVATSKAVNGSEDSALGIAVSGSDPEGQPITYALVNAPSHGTLSGTLPTVSYQPAANFNGPDSFTFRVSDGSLFSPVATITIAVAAVNDPPTATSEVYSANAGVPLIVNAPGVLGNDADVDGASLTAQLLVSPTHGTLTFNTNGSFTYTATAGYTGIDWFAYQASDGSAASSPVAAIMGVMPPGVVLMAGFASGAAGFTYVDDTFRATNQPSYASGSFVASGAYSGGGLSIALGGVNSNAINNMSGGWRRTFSLSQSTSLILWFRYRLNQGPDYEADDLSQVLASLDGVLVGGGAGGYITQVAGNGNGGASIDTGWQIASIALGVVQAGTHTVTIGGFNNKKNSQTEQTTIWFDDVVIVAQ